MRFPIMTRLLSVALVICCLAMLTAGIYGIDRAEKDREKGRLELSDMLRDAEDYESLNMALKGQISYAQAREELSLRQQQHREQASEHKQELTEYSAVKGGLTMGREAVDEARRSMEEGRAFYEQALQELELWEAGLQEAGAALEEGRRQYETGLPVYEMGVSALNGAIDMLNRLYRLDEIMDSGGDIGRLQLSLQAYDNAIAAFEGVSGFLNSLYQQGIVSPEQLQALEDMLIYSTGMGSGDILSLLYTKRAEIEAGFSEGLSPEEFEAVKAVYNANRELLMSAAAAVEELLIEAGWQLKQLGSQLEAAGEQLSAGEEMLRQGREALAQGRSMLQEAGAAIEQGGGALEQSAAEMDEKFAELEQQLQELREEKDRLSLDSRQLEELEAQAEERRELETRRTALSLKLREKPEIAELYDSGGELFEAVQSWAEAQRLSLESSCRARLRSCAAMVAGAIFGILSLTGIFHKKSSRAMRLVFPGICLLLSLSAELISLAASEGHVYSALTVSVLAALTLASALPNKKKKAAALA